MREDIREVIDKAVMKAKHKPDYFTVPFSILCDFLPDDVLNDEALMTDLEYAFYEWFNNGPTNRPSKTIVPLLRKSANNINE